MSQESLANEEGADGASPTAEKKLTVRQFFAALIILVMTGVNIVGSKLVANAQTVIVYVVLGILSVFAVVTLVNMTPSLLAPSGILVLSVALDYGWKHFRDVRTKNVQLAH
jgi:amino acid transporter